VPVKKWVLRHQDLLLGLDSVSGTALAAGFSPPAASAMPLTQPKD